MKIREREVEVIVTIVVPDTHKLVPGRGTGGPFDRDRIEVDVPAHTLVYHLVFDSITEVKTWLFDEKIKSSLIKSTLDG